MQGAVTVTLDGGGGAALMTGMVLDVRVVVGGGGGDDGLVDREVDGGGDGGLVPGRLLVDREIGGDGGLVIGGLRIRFIAGLAAGCGTAIVSFRQSCDWCKEDGVVVARTGGERGSRMLCALATLATLLARFSFLGGGEGFCRLDDGTGLGTAADFANPLGIVSELLVAESVVLCPCCD